MRGTNRRKTGRARQLRWAQTDAERKLWSRISNRQMAGYKFVRQEPLGPYIADFVCREHRIVVELDGSQHAESQHDAARDAYLASLGYQVLRFWNAEVFNALESVLDTILARIEERAHSPLPAGGERVTSADRPT